METVGEKDSALSSGGRSQSSKEKDFGSLFRSPSGASRKSPGNWDRQNTPAGSTVGGSADKEDSTGDKNSTASSSCKDEYRSGKDNHASSAAPTLLLLLLVLLVLLLVLLLLLPGGCQWSAH